MDLNQSSIIYYIVKKCVNNVDRQIDMIMRDLAPVMQKYAKLLQRIHGLDNMRFEDLKISVDPDYEPEISIEDSKNYIFGALSVLGDDYTNMLREAYDQRLD